MIAFVQQTMKVPYDIFSSANYRKFLWMLLKYGNAQRLIERKISFNGYQFTIPDVLSFVWQYKEIMVDRCYEFESNADQPVIYDCGANVGLASLFFAKKFPNAKIKAFEADKKISEIAQKNLTANHVTNVEVINKAVWINEDQLNFSSEGADGGSLMNNTGNKQLVQAMRLKDWLEKENSIDMLKIDIEGAETEVLSDCGDSLKNVQHLFVEYHSFSASKQNLGGILNILQKNGLRYNMENNFNLKQPLISKAKEKTMDMQLNIYAYRNKKK